VDPRNLYQAREMIEVWVDHYNNRRLHAGLQYLRPVDYYRGEPEVLLRERQRKMAEASKHRKEVWTKEADGG
jgi:transposase InsO family protein